MRAIPFKILRGSEWEKNIGGGLAKKLTYVRGGGVRKKIKYEKICGGGRGKNIPGGGGGGLSQKNAEVGVHEIVFGGGGVIT